MNEGNQDVYIHAVSVNKHDQTIKTLCHKIAITLLLLDAYSLTPLRTIIDTSTLKHNDLTDLQTVQANPGWRS